MSPAEKQKMDDLEKRVAQLEKAIEYKANRIYLKKSVVVDGVISSDKVYTQRSGNYVELTT